MSKTYLVTGNNTSNEKYLHKQTYIVKQKTKQLQQQ